MDSTVKHITKNLICDGTAFGQDCVTQFREDGAGRNGADRLSRPFLGPAAGLGLDLLLQKEWENVHESKPDYATSRFIYERHEVASRLLYWNLALKLCSSTTCNTVVPGPVLDIISGYASSKRRAASMRESWRRKLSSWRA